MGQKDCDLYTNLCITGKSADVFEPFGLMYRGPETRVFYQKPSAHKVDVRLKRGWMVLCLAPSRSISAIGTDRMSMAESHGPSMTFMPAHCDILVQEDELRTSDVVVLVPPVHSLEQAADSYGLKHEDLNYFWTEGDMIGGLSANLREILLCNEIYRVDPLEIESAVENSVDYLMQYYAREIGAASPTRKFGLTSRQTRHVSDYVDANLDSKITLKSLAEVAGVSQHHFARQFRISTGSSGYDYVLTKRILKAMSLLADTDIRLSEIALSCGFYDHAHMSNHFAKRMNVQPVKYRQIMRS